MATGIKVRELFTAWGFDIDAKPLKEMDKTIKVLKGTLGLVLGGIAAGGATLFGFAKFTADSRVELNKLSKQLGISAQDLKALQYSAKFSSTDVDDLSVGLRFLSRTSYDAAHGSAEARKALNSAGVSAVDNHGKLKPVVGLFLELSKRFKDMPQGERVAKVMDIFGRSGASLLPLLTKGPAAIRALMDESKRLNPIDDKKIKEAERFDDAMTAIGMTFKSIRNIIGDAALTPITDALEAAVVFLRENLDVIRETVRPLVASFLAGMGAAFEAIMGVIRVVLKLGDAFGGIQNVLKAVALIVGAFAIGKSILVIGDLIRTVWKLVAALTGVNGQLLLANALTGFVPVLLGLGALGADYALRGDRSIAGSLMGGGASPVQSFAGSSTSSSKTTVINVAPVLNTTVPPSTSPAATGQAVGSSAGFELSKLLRQSLGDVTSPVTH